MPALVAALLALVALSPERRSTQSTTLWHVTLAFVAFALLLTVAVEFLVVADIDIGRTNTVFKTYLQVWVLLGVAAAVTATRLYGRRERLPRVLGTGRTRRLRLPALRRASSIPRSRRRPRSATASTGPSARRWTAWRSWSAPSMSTRTRRWRLDDDLDAIRWFQEDVDGSPVVAEVNTYPTLYGWGNRYAMFTGNPAVIGWDFHQRQQRPGSGGRGPDARRGRPGGVRDARPRARLPHPGALRRRVRRRRPTRARLLPARAGQVVEASGGALGPRVPQ